MSLQLDLNADLGEGCAFDADLMSVVTSCNIACGGHAGDAASMRTALRLARANKVAPGAHPSFPDRENFGRAPSTLSGDELHAVLIAQVADLKSLAADEGVSLSHLKPHGALYNMAAQDADLAACIIAVLQQVLPGAALFGPPTSKLEACARANGVRFVAEGFADRAYETDGRLRNRAEPGAVLQAPEDQAEQALQMATRGQVTSYHGDQIALRVQTICVHGDTPSAVAAARAIKLALETSGLTLCPPD